MRVLITGNMGYVGPVLARHLTARHPGIEVLGFDNAYFGHALTASTRLPESHLHQQHFGDVREFPPALLQGVDAVVHLAAISNDPMGRQFEAVTDQINRQASVRLAQLARDAGVRSFVFASSCSVYGAAGSHARSERDPVNPLTAYARSKVEVETALERMDRGPMTVSCLRFATACGMSERLRLDLVLNDFVAAALTTGAIAVLSDGTPWRPLIDVRDMARAIDWAIGRDERAGGGFLRVNAGSDRWNYCVRDLAEAVRDSIPGTTVSINHDAAPDPRSYRVDFSLFRNLAPDHQPEVELSDAIGQLKRGIESHPGIRPDFRQSQYVRLRMLQSHIEAGRLSPDLRWQPAA